MMSKEFIDQLFSIEDIELIYCNTKTINEKQMLTYTIICNGGNVLSNMDTCKKIIAIMEIIKELYSKYNIVINYNIKSSYSFEEEITQGNNAAIKKFQESQINYSKDEYFQELINNKTNMKHTRA